MVQKKSGLNPREERESAVVREYRSSGFVPRSVETDAQKAAQRDGWDRAQNLAVHEDDMQLHIYNQYFSRSNTNSEGQTSRRGLGSGPSSGRGGGLRRPMSFVAAGGAPASLGSAPPSVVSHPDHSSWTAPGCALPAGWSSVTDPGSGRSYYVHMASGATQWEPPPNPTPSIRDALPLGWHAVTDPTSGRTYYANPTTGESSWTIPLVPPAVQPPLPQPPPSSSSSASTIHVTGPSVRIRGLPGSMSDADVREIFSSCGQVVSVSLERGAYSAGADVPKGATVTFDSLGSAQTAVRQMDGTKMRGSRLDVTLVQSGGDSGGSKAVDGIVGRGSAAAARANAKPY
eukprot:scaffold230772_cov40-Tisochrysis_lutea.AAC.1